MRVLFLTPMPPAPNAVGAIPLVLHAQLSALRERHDVTLVSVVGSDPQEWDAVEQLRASGLEVHAVSRGDPTRLARGWRWVSQFAHWIMSRHPMRTIRFYRQEVQHTLDRLLAERRFDIIHVEDNAMGIYDLPRDVPALFTEHEVRLPRAADWAGCLRGNAHRRVLEEIDWHRWPDYQRSVWRKFDHLEVFTARDARSMASIAPEVAPRVCVNPFGVEIPRAANPLLEEEGTVVFVGSFLHEPNVDAARWLALEIMPLIRVRNPDARLRIYGSDPRGLLRGLNRDGVDVCGWAPELEPVIERAAVIVAPVRIGGGQRMKVLYAMAMGKAVVTTPRGAEGLLGDNADASPLACGTTAEEIAELTAQLLRDGARRHALGARARAAVIEQHDVRSYGRRIDAAYVALSERGGAAPWKRA